MVCLATTMGTRRPGNEFKTVSPSPRTGPPPPLPDRLPAPGPRPNILDRQRARPARRKEPHPQECQRSGFVTRYRMDFAEAMIEDLRWLGLRWAEGPDVGRPNAPYRQSERRPVYRRALEKASHAAGLLYPCARSRRDVIEAAGAPHEGAGDDEPVFPASFRPPGEVPLSPLGKTITVNWGLRVPDGETLAFDDDFYRPAELLWRAATLAIFPCGGRTIARATSWPAPSTMRRWASPRSSAERTSSARPSGRCSSFADSGWLRPATTTAPSWPIPKATVWPSGMSALSLRALRAARG